MKRLLLILLTLGVLVSLAACGGGDAAANAAAGTYEGVHLKPVGDTEWVEEEFSLELKADGTGTHSRDGESFSVTWTLEGETFTMQETFLGLSIDYTGTLKGDDLDIFNGDPEDIWTYEYVYKKK